MAVGATSEASTLRPEGLVLVASSGARVLARRLSYAGPAAGDSVEQRRLVELVSLGTRVEHRLGTYRLERLVERANEDLVPDGKPVFTVPAAEVQRLVSWASGSSAPDTDARVVLVGEERATGRLRAALARLSLRVESQEDARRVLALVGIDPPDLLIVAPGAQGMDARELVRAVRRSHRPDQLPILLLGSLADTAADAGGTPCPEGLEDTPALLSEVAAILELV